MHQHSSSRIQFRRSLTVAALLTWSAAANAGTLFLSNLSGANEIPPTIPTATGLGVIIVNDAGTSSTISASWKNVTGITGGRIHRGAANANGPAIFPFAAVGNPSAPFTWNLSATALNDMKNGGLYLDLTTAAFPDGVIRGQIFQARLAPAAVTAPQARLAAVLDVSAGLDADLDQILIQTNLAPVATQVRTLDDLAVRTVYAPVREQIETMTDLNDSFFSQADDIRLNPGKASRRFSAFVKGGAGFGHRSASANQAGSTISRPFGAAGVEYGFSEHNRVGLAVGYADARDRFEEINSQTNTRTTTGHAFLSAQLGDTGVALDAVAGYGWSTVEATRNLGSLGRTAQAESDGTVWSAALKASRAFQLQQATLIPYAVVDFQEATLDAYRETGAGTANQVIPEITVRNSAIEGGATLILPIKVQTGALALRVQAGWRYLFEEGADSITTQLAGAPLGFVTEFDGPGRSSAHVEAALTATMVNGTLATLGYRGQLGGDGQTTNAVEARIIFRF